MDERPQLVIITCPCCSATLDTFPDVTDFSCLTCGQQFTMTIDPDRLAKYSL